MRKIFLTGTHHSGKTTLINKFKDKEGISVVDELVRALSTQANFKFTPEDKERYAFSELSLLHFYKGIASGLNLLPNSKLWLFDRCILDPLYYIKYFNVDLKLKRGNLYNYGLNMVTELILDGYFEGTVILLLKPIPIIEDDGFRLGEKEQIGVYEVCKNTLNTLGLHYEEIDSTQAEHLILFRLENL